MQTDEVIKKLDSPNRALVKETLTQLKRLGLESLPQNINERLWEISGESEDTESRITALEIIKSTETDVKERLAKFKANLFDDLAGYYLPYALNQLELSVELKNLALDILWDFVREKDKGKPISWSVFETIVELDRNSGKIIQRIFNEKGKNQEEIPWKTRGRFLLLTKIRQSVIDVWRSNDRQLRDSLILPSMLESLDDEVPLPSTELPPDVKHMVVKLAAFDFLQEGIKEIPISFHDKIKEIIRKSETNNNFEGKDKKFLANLDEIKKFKNAEEAEEKNQVARKYLEDIFEGSNFDKKFSEIEKLEFDPSEFKVEFFVKNWVDWIKLERETSKNEQQNVEKLNVEKLAGRTETRIRTCIHIVLPLIQQLRIVQHSNSESDIDFFVKKRIIQLLADVSDPRFFYRDAKLLENHKYIKDELQRHAVRLLSKLLGKERDLANRENIARTLGNIGDPVAVDALAQAVVGEERTRDARQKLLADYYLDPSKTQSEHAATMLKEAIEEAKKTLRLLQIFNGLVFGVGLALVVAGSVVSIQSDKPETRLAGGLAGLGGLAGVAYQLVKEPLNRIQNSMANLVQLETAFTSFIWELNLNGTYIQSQYIANGILGDKDIAQTVERIEKAMNLTMNLVSVYAEDGNEQLTARINNISPKSGRSGDEVVIYGQHLNIKNSSDRKLQGLITINHRNFCSPILWDDNEVRFKLPEMDQEEQPIWISLIVCGHETNAIPMYILRAK